MIVAVKMVLAADGAVGHIDIGPSIAIEIHDGYRSAHGSDFRHDRREFLIEQGWLMHKVDARGVSDFFKIEAIAIQGGLPIDCGRRGLSSRRKTAHEPGRSELGAKKDRNKNARGDSCTSGCRGRR